MNSTQYGITEFQHMSNTNKTLIYVDSVLPDDRLRIFSITLSAVAFLGVISNAAVVSLTRRESRYKGPLDHKRKKALMYYFVYNMALADLLSSLISGPSLVLLPYMHRFHTDAGCAVFRYMQYTFPALSNQILAVMCLERYCSLIFPFDNVRKKWPRRLVKTVWFSALFWAGMMSYSFQANTVFLSKTKCTMDCVQDLESTAKKAFYLSGLVLTFFIPLFIIFFTTIRLVLVLWKCERKANRVSLATAVKIQATWLAVWLVIIYAITFLPFLIYQTIKNFTSPNEVRLEVDSTIRYSFAILVFVNGVINPIMYLKNIRSLREKIQRILGLSTHVQTIVIASTDNVTFRNESSQTIPHVISRQTSLLRQLKVSPETISSEFAGSFPETSVSNASSHQSSSNINFTLSTIGEGTVGSLTSIHIKAPL